MEKSFRVLLQYIFGLGLIFLFFYMMGSFLVPILLAAVIAIVAYPMYAQLRFKIPRSLAALVTTLALAFGILIPLSLILYNAAYRLAGILSQVKLPTTVNGESPGVLDHPLLKSVLEKIERFYPVDHEWLKNQALLVLNSVLQKTSRVIAGSLADIPGFLLGIAIVVISVYFLLVDGPKLLAFMAKLSTLPLEKLRNLYRTFELSCRGVVVGLFASAVLQGTLLTIFCWMTGVPNAVFLGAICIVASMIPLFGSTPLTLGAVIYLFMQGRVGASIVMLVGTVIIGVSDNIVRTFVMKESIQMHPLLALVSVFGALSIMGPPGIFLGPIIAAVFVSFLKMIASEWEERVA